MLALRLATVREEYDWGRFPAARVETDLASFGGRYIHHVFFLTWWFPEMEVSKMDGL